MFTLTIKTDNAAFHDDDDGFDDDTNTRNMELARILREVAGYIADGGERGPCRDSNGNKVGTWEIES